MVDADHPRTDVKAALGVPLEARRTRASKFIASTLSALLDPAIAPRADTDLGPRSQTRYQDWQVYQEGAGANFPRMLGYPSGKRRARAGGTVARCNRDHPCAGDLR